MQAVTRRAVLAVTVMSVLLLGSAIAPAQEVVETEIAWNRNLYEGFQSAIGAEKPLVVYFAYPGSEFSEQLDRDSVPAAATQALASRAVWVRAELTDEDNLGNYGRLKQELKIDRYPIVVVLQVTPEHIREVGRIVGFFPAETFAAHLTTLLDSWDTSFGKGRLPAGWERYQSDVGRYEVGMPAGAETLIADSDVNQYAVGVHSEASSLGFAVFTQDLPEAVVQSMEADELLALQSKVAATTMNATIVDERPVQTAGHPGRFLRLSVAEGGQPMLVRSVLVGKRLYVLLVSGPDVREDHAEVTSFFGSFRPIAGPAAPSVADVAEATP